MDGQGIVKREQQILTGVAEKIGATLGSVAAGAQTVGKRLSTAASEAGKAYRATRATMAGKPRRTRPVAKKTAAKRRASSSVKRAALKTRSVARRGVKRGAAAVRRARKAAASKTARGPRKRR